VSEYRWKKILWMSDTPTPLLVRTELNEKFDALPLLRRDRATALYHLCTALEMSANLNK
jgi:hypothetical protein